MAIIAVAGQKGGVGKSTIAGNLAGEFGTKSKTVVVLDADPQHSLIAWAEQGDGMLRKCVAKVEGRPSALVTKVKAVDDEADFVIIDTPPGIPDIAYQAALLADLMLLPCGPSPLDLFAVKEALSLALKARAERRSKKPRIRLVPSKVNLSTRLGRGLASSLESMGKKVLPPICQRVVLAEAVEAGLTIAEFAPNSPAHEEFVELAKAVEKILKK
jgi:chromosome partitioning protein